MVMPRKQLFARDAKRDIGAEMLLSVRQLKAGLGKVAYQFKVPSASTPAALCPLCGQGQVSARMDQVESEYKGTKAMVPLHYAVCSACTSDFADAEQGRLNQLAVLAFRMSVDDKYSVNAD
jgi:hypothetical protein